MLSFIMISKTSNFKNGFKTCNDKINSQMKMCHYTSQTNSELLIMKFITLAAV